ncbi:MAG: hypothetical protein Ct9H300mP23_01230 [Nitrospinota bacterium]|nr:MAG: hypothetical protein Ct9H300mP23_01230 [Nitrospinota bacterium]
MLEINPLVITSDDRVLALDAKVDIDEMPCTGIKKHKHTVILMKKTLGSRSQKFHLNYIKLKAILADGQGSRPGNGNHGYYKNSVVNPGNFLDVGGGADEEMIENGFRILLSTDQ